MKNWTKAEMPNDLSDKLYIITGTSSGIGTVMASELVKRSARVIAANRNVEKAKKAIEKIQSKTDNLSSLRILKLDVSSLHSVREFSKIIIEDNAIKQIDGLLLNPGIMALPERKESLDGFELQMATNVLGHHLLTSLLMPKIKAARRTVIVSTTSSASSTVNSKRIWDDLNTEDKYDASKGVFATIFRSIRNIFMMDVNQGALSTLRATIDETLPNGSFIGPKGLTEFSGYPKPMKVYNPKLSLDPKF